ncbi:MAG: class I adenylate-forming enzyme family protein [Chloroflexota bacterium]
MTISDMLARNARLYPEDTALVELMPSRHIRREVTWREFDERANRIANALLERGVGRGDKVIHWMLNSIVWLEAYFGIIRTGAWAVPLNFRFTGEDMKYCTEIAEPKAVILGEEFLGRLDEVRSTLPHIEHYVVSGQDVPGDMGSLEDLMAGASRYPTGVPLGNDEGCGLYFTSGTTGAPKPILLSHGNMEWAAVTEQAHHGQTKDDNFILLPPLYHTGAKMHWFGNLLVGAKGTILRDINPWDIFSAVSSEGGTIVWLLVPWAHDILVALDSGELRRENYDLSRWRLMHIGAQPVPPSLVRRWKRYFPHMQYDTNYGLSEAAGPGCVHLGVENEHKVGSIGRSGYGWEAQIVGASGQAVRDGQVGELLVRGGGVMKGYFKNPEKTAETIRDGWLYTGDMARTDEDGFIYLVDRKRDVIITGGENIYPVEIEEVLHTHPHVYDAAVIGVPDTRLGEVAVAVIEMKPGASVTRTEMSAFCEERLARHKRPRRIVFDRIPRNPTGKIEKPKLRRKYRSLPLINHLAGQ